MSFFLLFFRLLAGFVVESFFDPIRCVVIHIAKISTRVLSTVRGAILGGMTFLDGLGLARRGKRRKSESHDANHH